MEASAAAHASVVYSMCKGLAGPGLDALTQLEQRLGEKSPHVQRLKAAVGAISSGDVSSNIAAKTENRELLELSNRQSALGRAPFVPAPIGRVAIEDTAPVAAWVTAADPIPVSNMALSNATLQPASISTILVESKELLRSKSPRAVHLFERRLIKAIAAVGDSTLFDDVAAVSEGRPAGLLYNVAAIGGGSPSNIESDVANLLTGLSGGNPSRPVYFTSIRGGAYLAQQRDSGVRIFPDAGPLGGSINGVPLITSAFVPDVLVCCDCDRVVVSDEGLEIDQARGAAIQMSTTPSAGAQNLVSLFQAGAVALRVTRFLYWAKADDSVAWISLPV